MQSGTGLQIEVFNYPASAKPLPVLWDDIVEIGGALTESSADKKDEHVDSDNPSQRAALASADEQLKRSFEAGREQGMRQGREIEAKAQSELRQETERRRAEQAGCFANQFVLERDRFMETVEQEVVKLALAIAARILRREAQIDPLFLIGAVRVALGQLAATLQVRLRVPASEASLWTETLEHLPNLKVKPSVVPDESMHAGECAIESNMGSVDLGLCSQLHQVERALFDDAPRKETESRIGSAVKREEMPA